MTITSYVVLSTQGVTKDDEKEKLQIIKVYDFTKGRTGHAW